MFFKNLELVKEDENNKKVKTKKELPQTDAEVIIDVERKISKDSLTSIKVVSKDQMDQVAVSLQDVSEESQSINVITKDETEHVAVSLGEEAGKSEDKILEVTVKTSEEKSTPEEIQEMSAEVAVEVEAMTDSNESPSEVAIGDATDETDGITQPFLEYEIDDELPWAMYRSLNAPPTSRVPLEEEEEWPQSEEDEEYGRYSRSMSMININNIMILQQGSGWQKGRSNFRNDR
jgi:hypothetical protein